MSQWLSLATAVVMCMVIVALAVGILRKRRSALEEREKLWWYEMQLDRTLRDLDSTEADRVIGALQMVWLVPDETFRLAALRRLDELRQSGDERIARQAEVAFKKVAADADGNAGASGRDCAGEHALARNVPPARRE